MVRLRKASIADADLLSYWDTKTHVLESDPDDEWHWKEELPREVPWRQQLMAELNGRPIGFVQIIDPLEEESHYWGDVPAHKRAIDIWIGEESDLGKGYGTIMMQLAIDHCFEDDLISGILIDPLKSNTKAHRFYKRMGFEVVEEREFNGLPCLVMELKRPTCKIFVLDGAQFNDIEGFYEFAYATLTKDLDWSPAHNLDAFNDILYGGFGAFEPKEQIIVRWINFEKSALDLGLQPSIKYYLQRAENLTGNRAAYFRKKAEDLKSDKGETLLTSICQIIEEKEWIQLVRINNDLII